MKIFRFSKATRVSLVHPESRSFSALGAFKRAGGGVGTNKSYPSEGFRTFKTPGEFSLRMF